MIKPLTPEEVENLDTDLSKLFFEEASLPGRFDTKVFKHNWINLIKSNVGVLFGLYRDDQLVGVLGAILFPDINSGELTASETFWYVHQKYRGSIWGVKLFNTFIEWAEEMEASRVIMAHLVNSIPDKLESFYERKGFKKTEIHFVKEL